MILADVPDDVVLTRDEGVVLLPIRLLLMVTAAEIFIPALMPNSRNAVLPELPAVIAPIVLYVMLQPEDDVIYIPCTSVAAVPEELTMIAPVPEPAPMALPVTFTDPAATCIAEKKAEEPVHPRLPVTLIPATILF